MAREDAQPRTRIADALVIVLPEGGSLSWWHAQGTLEREWTQYESMADWYGRIVVLTPGIVEDDERSLHEVRAGAGRVQVRVIGAGHGRAPQTVIGDLIAALDSARCVVIKTAQMGGCAIALDVQKELRERGIETGLIARGGFLWSRFVAHDEGTNSSAAQESSLLEGELCRHADIIVGTTTGMIEDLSWRYGLDPSRCHVVPHYVLVDHPAMTPRDREKGFVLSCGPLIARKRFHLLIDAFAELAGEGGEWRLEIMGDGPEFASLTARAKERGVPVTITTKFCGSEVLEKMSRCGLYAQTSQLEGHPQAVLEAMACGATPVVCDTPGLGPSVQHGVTGLRCSSEPGAIAHVIRELMGDEDWRQMLGSSASRLTQEAFGLPNILKLEREVHELALMLGRAGRDHSHRASA